MSLEEKILEKVFTEIDNRIDAKVNKLTAKCIDSENNTFSIDCEGNLSVKSLNTEITPQKTIWFPIGTLYWNDNDISNTISECFEGTWERVEDVFILAAGKQFQAGTNGGEITHTLTTKEMPSHSHMSNPYDAGFYKGWGNREGWGIQSEYIQTGGRFVSDTTGDSEPHNNMPPYHTSYCWKRIA